MRRVMLLALLALALPMAVSAAQIQIRYNTGTQGTPGGTPPTATGTFTPDFPADFTATVSCPTCTPLVGAVGGNTTITFSTMNLDCSGAPFCTFGTGDVTVMKGSSTLFMSGVSGSGATIFLLPTQFIMTGGQLIAPFSDPFAVGGSLGMGLQFDSPSTGVLNSSGGNAAVIVNRVVPEPGTFVMLGTGLIGLAGMAMRKLKLGT